MRQERFHIRKRVLSIEGLYSRNVYVTGKQSNTQNNKIILESKYAKRRMCPWVVSI